jgi:hypothetical protein
VESARREAVREALVTTAMRWALVPAALIAVLLLYERPRAAADESAAAKTVVCSFSNPAFSGFCRESRGVARTDSGARVCAGILACLNDPRCAKTYCSATQIRGGWRLEKIEAQTAAPKTTPPAKGGTS